MAFGIQIENAQGELTISDSGITYGFIGRANLISVTQAGTSGDFDATGRSTYGITWAGDIVVALPLKMNGSTALKSVTRSGNSWTIEVHKSNGTVDALGFDNQEATEVYVFGAPTGASGFGCALYASTGEVVADFNRRPIICAGRVSVTQTADWAIPGGVSVPLIIGNPTGASSTSTSSGSFWITKSYTTAWRLSSTMLIGISLYMTFRSRDDGVGQRFNSSRSANALLVEGRGL